jgi:transcription termination factor Rho
MERVNKSQEQKEEAKVEVKAQTVAELVSAGQPATTTDAPVADDATPLAEGEQQAKPEGGDSPTDDQNKDGGYRGRGRGGGRGGYRGNKPNNFYFRKHNTDEEGFTVVKDEENHNSHYPSRRHQNATRGGYRGGRGGQYKEGEGQRGDRGGRGGRPWTAKEHRNQGEVRKPEFEQTVENNGPKSDAQ